MKRRRSRDMRRRRSALKFILMAGLLLAASSAAAGAAHGGARQTSVNLVGDMEPVTPPEPSNPIPQLQLPSLASAAPAVECNPGGCGSGGGGTCSDIFDNAGYAYNRVVSVGASASVKIDPIFDYLNSTGHVDEFVAVGNQYASQYSSPQAFYIQAGVVDGTGGGGLSFFIQTDNGGYVSDPYYDAGGASYGANYTATITHPQSGVWKASINGVTAELDAAMTFTSYEASGEAAPGTECQVMDIKFSAASPWTTSTMSPPLQQGPYWVTNITSNGWETAGP